MKKIRTFLMLLLMCSFFYLDAQSPNPIVRRLSSQEIAECKTPSAVTYNFVSAILQKDFVKMRSYMAPDAARMFAEADKADIEELFSTGKLGMFSWLPALSKGYEVAIAYVQDEWYYEENGYMYHPFDYEVKNGLLYIEGEEKPRVGINEKKVYVTCSPSSEVNHAGFQDITRYGDTNVKVLLKKYNGVWKVTGFK